MSEESVEIVRCAYAAFNRRDIEAIAAVTDPDLVMDWSRSMGPQRNVYRGHAGIKEWIVGMDEAFETFEVSPLEFHGSGSRIVVPTRVSGKGRGSGAVVEAQGATVWELRDGKVVGMTLYQSRQEALEAAGIQQ
jgi:ketosteroid isomerase-like protein